MIPTVGQIVLFSTTLNGLPASRAAIVTSINEDGTVNIALLHPTDFGISTDLLTDPAAPPAEDPEVEPEVEGETGYQNRCSDGIKDGAGGGYDLGKDTTDEGVLADDDEENKKFPL